MNKIKINKKEIDSLDSKLNKLYENDYFETTIIPKLNISKLLNNIIPMRSETIEYQEDEDKINDFFAL